MDHIVYLPSVFGRIAAYRDDLITQQIRDFGNHTRPEFAFATSILGPGMTCLDLGAHIGTFTLLARQKVCAFGKVYAVEPMADTFEILEKNVRRAPNENVVLRRALIGEAGKIYQVVRPDGNTGASFFSTAETAHLDTPTLSLSQLLDEIGVTIDYLKIDIEGLEYTALLSAPALFEMRPVIYMEVSRDQLARHGASIEQLDQLLCDRGYTFFVNSGDRNADHDVFRVKHLPSLTGYKPFFDALCVPAEHKHAKVLHHAAS
ncbi:MAG: FkbM family methyltransferase [Pseudomonadota bacterium]